MGGPHNRTLRGTSAIRAPRTPRHSQAARIWSDENPADRMWISTDAQRVAIRKGTATRSPLTGASRRPSHPEDRHARDQPRPSNPGDRHRRRLPARAPSPQPRHPDRPPRTPYHYDAAGGLGLPAGPFVAEGTGLGRFDPPEAVASVTAIVAGPALAIAPKTQQPSVVWIEMTPGTQYTAVTRFARRTSGP